MTPFRSDEAQDGAAGHRLARARRADYAELLAAEREGDSAHRLDQSLARREGDLQVLDGEQRLCCPLPFAHPWPPLLGSSTSRRPSPSRLNPRLTMKMAMPGTVATHHWLISPLRPLEILAPRRWAGRRRGKEWLSKVKHW